MSAPHDRLLSEESIAMMERGAEEMISTYERTIARHQEALAGEIMRSLLQASPHGGSPDENARMEQRAQAMKEHVDGLGIIPSRDIVLAYYVRSLLADRQARLELETARLRSHEADHSPLSPGRVN